MKKISAYYLENKKVLFLKNIQFKPLSLNRPREFKQMVFAFPIFNEGFGFA